ncbi:hypothetical protein BC332_24237 [Capsicum chinense]|nr:hypothetical protein BC332_24237 [Capsicum chinense]
MDPYHRRFEDDKVIDETTSTKGRSWYLTTIDQKSRLWLKPHWRAGKVEHEQRIVVWAKVGAGQYVVVRGKGVGLSREYGKGGERCTMGKIDFQGNAFGLLAAHPNRPLVSLHHMEKIDPIFPNMSRMKTLLHLYHGATFDPHRILQQTVCYDSRFSWTISVSWGYVVQIFEHNVQMRDAQRVQESWLPRKKNAYGTFYEFNNRKFESDPCRRQEARRLGLKSVVGVKIGTSSGAIEEKINEIVESLTSNLEESLNGTIQFGPSKALSINPVILKANKKEAQQQWLGMVLDTGSQRSDPLSTGKKSWEWLDTMPFEKVTFLPEGISDHCPAKLTYLIFAYDLMVFCKGKEGSIIKIKESLAHFNVVTELVVNMKKSSIFLALIEDNVKAQIMSLTGFSQGGLLICNLISLFFRQTPSFQFRHPVLQAGS